MRKQTLLKSTLCLLMALVCNVMWAQTFVQPETGKYYKIKGDNPQYPWLTGTLKGSSIVVSANEGDAAVFEKTANGLMALATGKYLGLNGTTVSLVDKEGTVTIGEHKNNAGKLSVKAGTHYMYNNNTDGITHESESWRTDIPGYWGFIEVEMSTQTYTINFQLKGKQVATTTFVYPVDMNVPEARINNAVPAGYLMQNYTLDGTTYTVNVQTPTSTDGPIVTFTNVQKDKTTTFTLYINENNQLAISDSSAADLGNAAKFRATLLPNGKYTFYNEEKELYMIWRGGSSGGHNSNKGVLGEYNATYCDWTMNASANLSGGYYFYSKRSDGTSDGSLVILKGGTFDAFGNTEGWADGHTNVYKIESEEYVATLTDNQGAVLTCTAKGFIPSYAGASLGNQVWTDGDLTAAINTTFSELPFPVSSIGEAAKLTMISSFKDGGGSYPGAGRFKWYAEGDDVKIQRDASTMTREHLWAIYPSLENGALVYSIKNIATGKYIFTNATFGNSDGNNNKGTVILSDTPTKFSVDNNNSLYYYTNGRNHFLSWGSVSTASGYLGVHTKTVSAGHNGITNSFHESNYTLPDKEKFVNGDVYTFVTNRGWVGANADSEVAIGTVKTTANPAASAENPNFLWTVYKSQKGNYYLYNIGKKKFLGAPSNDSFPFVEIPTSKDLSFKISGTAEYPIMFSTNNRHAVSQNANAGLFAWEDGWNKLDDGGSNHKVTLVSHLPEATLQEIAAIVDDFEFEGEPISGVEDFVNGGIYNFVTERGWMGATLNGTNVISTAKTSNGVTGRAKDPMFQWTVYKSTKGHYYLYNIGKKMFMGVESRNNTSVPFVEQPAGKKLTFKESASDEYPFMFSTDNAGVVNHSTSYGEGLVTWTGGWDKLDDGGSNHKISYVGALAENELATISELVERYDQQLYVTYEVEMSENNPNTHFGSVRATSASGTFTTKLKKGEDVVMLDYNGLEETTIDFTRAYRGFEFQGFKLGGQELDKSFKISEELKNSITEENPLVAKFTATDEVTLFYDDDPFSYRIPAIGKTSTGRLIAVSDYRYSLDDIGRYNFGTANPGIDLVMRYSDDKGKTWSDTKTIAKGSCKRGTDDCAYGDAAIAVVGQKVLVMGAAGDVMFGSGSATAHNRAIRIFSEDNGVTWTKQDISETLFLGDDATIKNGYSSFFGSGRLAVDENYNGTGKARIYGALLLKKASGTGNYVIYTDDLGLTWHILGGSQDPVATQDEPKVEILPSGQILLSVRRGGGRQFNVFTYSDKATNAGTWDNNVNGCSNGGSNTCNGEIYVVDAKKADGSPVKLLLQSQPKGGGGLYDRRDVTIWYKEVDNTNYTSSQIASDWTQGLQVSTQLSAYSTMTLQDDGKIAFFFEEAPCYDDDYAKGYCMVYVPLSISEITIGKYADQNSEAKAVNVNVTDDMGNIYDLDLNIFADDEEAIKDLVKATWSFAEFGASPELTKEGNTYTYTNTVTLPFKVSNNETTVWHNIYWHGSKENELVYLYGGASGDEHVAKKAPGSGIPYGASDYNTAKYADNMNWAIYHAGNFTFTFKNKLTNKFIQVEGVATNSENNGKVQNAKFVEKGATAFEIMKKTANQTYKGDYSLKATVEGVVGYLCNTSASYEWATHYTGNSHEGGWATFNEAPDFTSLIAEVSNVLSLIGENLQQYTVTAANTEIAAQAKTAMQKSDTVKLNDLNTYKNLMDGATLNLPAAGQFYRIKSCSNGKYLGNTVDDTSNTKTLITVDSNEADPSIIYYFEPGPTNGQYYLMSYANGHYLANPWRIGVGSETIPTTNNETFKQYTEIAEGQRTMYVLKYANGSSNLIKVSEEKTNYSTDKDADDAQWTFEPVTSLPFTFKGAALGFATFCAPVNVQLYEGVVAYIAEILVGDGNNYKLKMRRIVGDVVPAYTPVLLYKEGIDADVTVNFNMDNVECNFTANDLESQNHFYRTIEAETLESGYTYYSLQKGSDDKLGFYLKNYGTLGGFKAWIKITNPNSPQAFTIFFDGDDATGLKEALGLENENVEIYDLSGRRLDKPTKGINVVDGKLVIK